MLRDEMEKEQRGARAAAAARREAAKAAKAAKDARAAENPMPGGGQTLSGDQGDQSEDEYFSDPEGRDK